MTIDFNNMYNFGLEFGNIANQNIDAFDGALLGVDNAVASNVPQVNQTPNFITPEAENPTQLALSLYEYGIYSGSFSAGLLVGAMNGGLAKGLIGGGVGLLAADQFLEHDANTMTNNECTPQMQNSKASDSIFASGFAPNFATGLLVGGLTAISPMRGALSGALTGTFTGAAMDLFTGKFFENIPNIDLYPDYNPCSENNIPNKDKPSNENKSPIKYDEDHYHHSSLGPSMLNDIIAYQESLPSSGGINNIWDNSSLLYSPTSITATDKPNDFSISSADISKSSGNYGINYGSNNYSYNAPLGSFQNQFFSALTPNCFGSMNNSNYAYMGGSTYGNNYSSTNSNNSGGNSILSSAASAITPDFAFA